jgi:DNA-directed RNA polymerase specialized sigma24 family protein
MTEARALAALAEPDALLAPLRLGARGFGVFAGADRRRRPRLTVPGATVRRWLAEGAIVATDERDCYRLTKAGRSRGAREGDHAFLAQHGPIEMRVVLNEAGQDNFAVAQDPVVALSRLAKLKGPDGAAWLKPDELAAARRLALDAEAALRGGMRLSRWAGDHAGGAVGARGSNGAETAMEAGMEARRRLSRALEELAPPLRGVVQAACLEGVSLDLVERRSAWPARSAKVALKLALSQLAKSYRGL